MRALPSGELQRAIPIQRIPPLGGIWSWPVFPSERLIRNAPAAARGVVVLVVGEAGVAVRRAAVRAPAAAPVEREVVAEAQEEARAARAEGLEEQEEVAAARVGRQRAEAREAPAGRLRQRLVTTR